MEFIFPDGILCNIHAFCLECIALDGQYGGRDVGVCRVAIETVQSILL